MQRCYRCNKRATTREHVPPRCLFPGRRDADGIDYRSNLITVPSCDEHNLEKSSDDEFLMLSLSSLVGNNPLAYQQTITKVTRAMRRSRGRLLRTVIRNSRGMFLGQSEGPAMPVLRGEADLPRLTRAFESIALGLYYHENSISFRGECVVLPVFLSYSQDNLDGGFSPELLKWIARLLVENDSRGLEWKGSNPAVFAYQVLPADQEGLIAILMRFFEGADVYVSLIPEGVVPFHRRRGLPPNQTNAPVG